VTDLDHVADVVAPPAGLWFAYRFLGWRLDGPYRTWLLADLADPRWLRRYRVRHLAMVATSAFVLISAVSLRYGRFPTAGIGGFIGSALGPFIFPERIRRSVARRQLLPGEETTWWHRLSNLSWTGLSLGALLQVDAPGEAVLVRVGPPVSLYAVVRRRDDATLDVQPVQLSAPGIYREAIDDLDHCT